MTSSDSCRNRVQSPGIRHSCKTLCGFFRHATDCQPLPGIDYLKLGNKRQSEENDGDPDLGHAGSHDSQGYCQGLPAANCEDGRRQEVSVQMNDRTEHMATVQWKDWEQIGRPHSKIHHAKIEQGRAKPSVRGGDPPKAEDQASDDKICKRPSGEYHKLLEWLREEYLPLEESSEGVDGHLGHWHT